MLFVNLGDGNAIQTGTVQKSPLPKVTKNYPLITLVLSPSIAKNTPSNIINNLKSHDLESFVSSDLFKRTGSRIKVIF